MAIPERDAHEELVHVLRNATLIIKALLFQVEEAAQAMTDALARYEGEIEDRKNGDAP